MKNRKLIAFCALLALIGTALWVLKPTQGASDRTTIIRQLDTSPEAFISVETTQGNPFTIEQATVKQINGFSYATITNDRADIDTDRVSLPAFTAVNRSDKTINAFGVCLASRTKKVSTFCFIKQRLNFAPGQQIKVERNEALEFRVNARRKTPNGQSPMAPGRDKTADFNYPEMWSPGQPNDYYLFLINADFSDGSNWMNPAVAAELPKQKQ